MPPSRIVSRLAVLALLRIASLTPMVHADPSGSDPGDPFEQGARYWSVTAGGSGDAPIAWVYFTQLHVSHYVLKNLAVVYGGIVGYVNGKRGRGGVLGGPELGARWHVATSKRWSTYLEGVVGVVLQQSPLSEHTLRFNFELQPGVGATYRLRKNVLLHGGWRWHHISNARIRGKAHNFGYDGPLLYLELTRSF